MANLVVYKTDNIKCMRGDTFSHVWKFYEDDAATVPADMSALAFKGEVRDGQSDTDTLVLSLIPSDFIVSGTSSNEVTLLKSKTEMVVEAGNYYYDVEAETAGGIKKTILRGKFDVVQDITFQ